MFEPNSPTEFKTTSRKQRLAAKYAKRAKVCFAVTLAGFVLLLLMCFLIKSSAPWAIFFFLPFLGIMALGFYYQKQERKLRCTKQTTAVCVNTVLRNTSRIPSRHPIVEYEVDGEKHTAELSTTCTKGAVGETYVIYYDPLDPSTVRTE